MLWGTLKSGRVGSENDLDAPKISRQQAQRWPTSESLPSLRSGFVRVLPVASCTLPVPASASQCQPVPALRAPRGQQLQLLPWLERAYQTPIGKSQQSIWICRATCCTEHSLRLTIRTISHHGQHIRNVIALCLSTRRPCLCARADSLIVTAVYTAGHSSWPLTGPSTDTSGAARPCTSAPSSKPTPTSASPDNRE